jgi:hypothetical protein
MSSENRVHSCNNVPACTAADTCMQTEFLLVCFMYTSACAPQIWVQNPANVQEGASATSSAQWNCLALCAQNLDA